MKQEAKKKNKLWLVLLVGVLILALVVGGAAALVIGLLGSGKSKDPGGRAKLYWNVDRKAYTENSESGLSTREPGEDGQYRVRFAINGELVELPVVDKQLVNFIDTMDAMGLIIDDGVVVDVVDAKEIAKEVNRNAYVKSMTDELVVVNTSLAMNGMNINIKIEEITRIYDVTADAEVPGQIIQVSDLKAMDTLCVYANDLDQVTHVYVTAHQKESKVYWRAAQNFNFTTKETAREPDENGAYTMDFFCDGELVTLKTKDKAIATKVDSVSRLSCHFGFSFDEEGYIVEQFSSALGIKGTMVCERWDVISIEDGFVTIQRLLVNDGSVWSGNVPADCVVYDVSPAATSEGRQGKPVDGLKVGDRVCVWADTNGNPILAYVAVRLVDRPAYWIPSRKYSSVDKETTREVGPSGYYEVELLKEGNNRKEVYYIKDKETMSFLDSQSSNMVGMKVGENRVVEYVYDSEAVTGYSCATRGGVVTTVTGSIFTKMTYGKPGTDANLLLAPGAKVYNVSTYGAYGGETKLLAGDHIYGYSQPTGELSIVFITKRTIGANSMYYNLERLYDSKNKTTKRVPDADGWYIFNMVHNGKQVTMRTKSKEVATKVDSFDPTAMALEVSGDIILAAHDPTYACGGSKVASGYRYQGINSEGKYSATFKNGTTGKVTEASFVMAENCKIYNVSPIFKEYQGERVYSIQKNDMITAYTNKNGEAEIIFIRQRDVDNMYWKTETLYLSGATSRTPDADGYYWYTLAVNGECKAFKTKDQKIANSMDYYAGAFGLSLKGENEIVGFVSPSYVKNVQGNGVNGYCVTKIDGKKITLTCNKPGTSFGKTETITLTSGAKIFDVTPFTGDPAAAGFGKVTQLKVGDTIRTYLSRDGKTHNYVYVLARSTRKGGEVGYCQVCKKEVIWNPLVNSVAMSKLDGHWYVSEDMYSYVQHTLGNATKDFTVCLDLNGKTLKRANTGRMFSLSNGEVLNIMDSVGGGKVISSGGKGYYGGVLMLGTGSVVNLYSGTIAYEYNDQPTYMGGVACLDGKGTTFNQYGGEITGGRVYALTKDKGYGGNFYLRNEAAFNMYGGVVSNGQAFSQVVETVTDGKTTYTARAAHGGNFFIATGAKINIFGGEVTGGQAHRISKSVVENGTTVTKSAVAYGGNFYLSSKTGELYVGKATISDGYAHRGGNIYGRGFSVLDGATVVDGTANQRGANIVLVGESMTLTGGTKILNGIAGNDEYNGYGGNIAIHAGEMTIENAIVDGGQAKRQGTGGNIYLYRDKNGDSVLNIKDGAVISNGVAGCHGGNIYQNDFVDRAEDGTPLLSTLNLTGGQILNGKCDDIGTAKNYGGNIFSSGHMNLDGGIISGGLQGTEDYDIYLGGNGHADVMVSNVQVDGKFRNNGIKSFTLSGAPRLAHLDLNKNVKISVGELTDDAKVVVATANTSPVFSNRCEKAQDYVDAKYFEPYDTANSITVTANNELQCVEKAVIAWCDHCNSNVEWFSIAPVSGEKIGTSGHYYLKEDLNLNFRIYVGTTNAGTAAEGIDLVLDLAGHNITSTESVFYVYKNHTLSLIDSVGTSVVTGQGTELKGQPRDGGLFYVERGNVNIYGGTYNFQPTSDKKCGHGGIMYAGNSVNLYGGTFNSNGGTIASGSYLGDAFYMPSNSSIFIGDAVINGEVYTSATTKVTLSGAPIITELDLSTGVIATLEDLKPGTNVGIVAEGAFTKAHANAQAYLDGKYFTACESGLSIKNNAGVLTVVDAHDAFDGNAVYNQAIAMTFTSTEADGKVTADCPVCLMSADWYPLPNYTSTSGAELSRSHKIHDGKHHHYYLSETVDYTHNTGFYSLASNTKVCLNLNGQNITSSTRTFYAEGGNTVLNIMGQGTVTGAGPDATRGCLDATAAINLYGGTFVGTNEFPTIGMRSSSNPNCILNVYEGTTIQNSSTGTGLYATKIGGINIHGGNVCGVLIDSANAKLTVSGAAVVGDIKLTNGALMDVGELVTGANITVNTQGVFTNDLTNAAAALTYFHTDLADMKVDVKGNALAVLGNNDPNKIYNVASAMDFKSTADAEGKVTADCPVCLMSADWYPLPNYTSTSGPELSRSHKIHDGKHHHYYLSETVDYTHNTGFYSLASNTKVCLNLNGQNVTSTTRTFYAEGGNTVLNIMGQGTVTGAGTDGDPIRGCLDATTAINLYGGTFVSTNEYPTVVMRSSSNPNCILNVYEGTTIQNNSTGTGLYATRIGGINIHGGNVCGVLIDSANAKLTVSGAAVVGDIKLTNGALMDVGELVTGANITVNTQGVFTNDLTNAAAALTYFRTDLTDMKVDVKGNALTVVANNTSTGFTILQRLLTLGRS